jgi:hypothetical protein
MLSENVTRIENNERKSHGDSNLYFENIVFYTEQNKRQTLHYHNRMEMFICDCYFPLLDTITLEGVAFYPYIDWYYVFLMLLCQSDSSVLHKVW